MFVFCEKLILISDPSRREWWRALLRPREEPFLGGGRGERAQDEEDAVAKALLAREEGFRPIVMCPSAASRERAGDLFRAQRKSATMLVRGYDDAAIRALIRSPSREVLLALAGQRTLVEPSQAYMDALHAQLAAHRGAREFMRSVTKAELHLEDFRLLEEPGENAGPVLAYPFEWRLDPEHRLAVVLKPLQHEARAAYTVARRPQAGSIRAAEDEEWSFDATGQRELDARDLQRIADTFDIEDDFLRLWADTDRGPLVTVSKLNSVQAWLKERTEWPAEALNAVTPGVESPMPLLNSSQWKAAFAALGAAQPAVAGETAGQTATGVSDAALSAQPQRVPPSDLRTPLLLLAPGEYELLFNVTWEPLGKSGSKLPETRPNLAIDVDGQTAVQAQVHWREDFQTLSVSGLSLPAYYRYGWEWDGKMNRLQLQIVTLPASMGLQGKTQGK